MQTDIANGAHPRKSAPSLDPRRMAGRGLFTADDGSGSRAPSADTFGRLGALEVRLATGVDEVRRAQRLRYRVFYGEMAATPSRLTAMRRRDVDGYDALCDHLLVLDHDAKPRPFRARKPRIVGTYRLLRQSIADAHSGFYTAGEYEIAPLLAAHPEARFVELGRSCVRDGYRNRRTIELLWQGIWAYVRRHHIDVMIGCASLPGTDPARLALPLSYLHHFAPSPEPWRVRANAGRRVPMDMLPRDALDPKAALKSLPPLVKAYLRVGATFGDGAVVDGQFGTTDVFVVMPIAALSARYIGYFGPSANRFAA